MGLGSPLTQYQNGWCTHNVERWHQRRYALPTMFYDLVVPTQRKFLGQIDDLGVGRRQRAYCVRLVGTTGTRLVGEGSSSAGFF